MTVTVHEDDNQRQMTVPLDWQDLVVESIDQRLEGDDPVNQMCYRGPP